MCALLLLLPLISLIIGICYPYRAVQGKKRWQVSDEDEGGEGPAHKKGKQVPVWTGVQYYNLDEQADADACRKALSDPLLRMISGDLSIDDQMKLVRDAALASPVTLTFPEAQKLKIAKLRNFKPRNQV